MKAYKEDDVVAKIFMREFMDSIAERYNITTEEDWMHFSLIKLDTQTRRRLDALGRLKDVLDNLYPEMNVKTVGFKTTEQLKMKKAVHHLLPESNEP